MKKKIFTIVLVSMFSVFAGSAAMAGTAILDWDANSESDLAGYKLHYDTASRAANCPNGYANHVDVGNVTTRAFDDLTPGSTYYFQLTAYDTSNNESTCSTNPGEVSKLVTYRGDLNNDHAVNIFDYSIFVGGFGQSGSGLVPDIDRNGTVNIFDYTHFTADFGRSF